MKSKKIWGIALPLVVILLVVLGAVSLRHYQRIKPIEYAQHLDEVLLTVDGQDITLAECAYYVASGELMVEEQALIYDYHNPQSYWNLHINGEFVKVAAKQSVLDKVVHDEIFYRQALAEGLTLTEEEQQTVRTRQEDFWMDLTEEQRSKLGVSREEMDVAIDKAALAEKYQNEIAAANNSDYEGYSVGALPYETMLGEHTYEVDEAKWAKISFGDIILTH
ncbi:MAG: hypothetical protein K2N01_09890 [Lachnospiraceae bacterium]|nr:hypothetical protein [Lachnospiraceae bacterium]